MPPATMLSVGAATPYHPPPPAPAPSAPPPRRELPKPDYLPPVKQMAAPGRTEPPAPFAVQRDWERPRRFEAYPRLRTRVGMGMPRLARLPPVAVGAIALMLAAAVLFALPGMFAGRPGGGSEVTRRPSASVPPSVSAAPTTAPLPTPQVYTVKRGDTFSGIARQFGLTIAELQAANPQIRNISALQIGDRINIPNESASPPPASPSPVSAPPDGTDGTEPTPSATGEP